MKWATHKDKAILLWFTAHASISSRYFEQELLTDTKTLQKIKKNFVVACLYVDDKRKLSRPKLWNYGQLKKKLNTIGDENTAFQIERFQSAHQPELYIISPDGQDIIEKFNYNSVQTSQEIDSVIERSLHIFNTKFAKP